MKNQKFSFRKFITFLAFVMILSAFGTLSFSASAEEVCGDFLYKINDEGYAEITGYIGKNKNEVVIPSDVDGYEVKAVKKFKLSGKNVNRVVISEGIETIKAWAFEFSEISEVVFPESLRTIEKYAFKYSESLYSCQFQEGLETIGESAFYKCPIQNLELPDSIVEISQDAFYGHKTKQIKTPKNAEYIGSHALGSLQLQTVIYDSENLSIDKYAFDEYGSYGGYTATDMSNIKNVIVAEGITNIAPYTFFCCYNIVSVQLPSTLKKIGTAAFSTYNCIMEKNSLRSVIIPSGVKVIGSGAFYEDTVIYGKKGSAAYSFASENGNKFINNDISQMTFKYKTEWVYTGEEICPSVTVTNLGYTPSYNKDYTVTYSNNIKRGTGKITITGKGVFVGQKVLTFRIGYDMTKVKVTFSNNCYTYNPNGVLPSITVKYGKYTLTKDKDYTVTYKNNRAIGTAALILKGAGNFVGSVTKSFYIVPANVTGFTVSSRTATSLTFKWNKVSGSEAYAIFVYNSSTDEYDIIDVTSKTSYTLKNLKSGVKKYYAVAAYKIVRNTCYMSEYLTVLSTATNPGKPTLSSTAGYGKATLKWSKQTCSGYEVYMKTRNGSYKKIATVKGSSTVSLTKSGLTKGKTYYFKVRAFTTVNGKNVYGDFSSAKSVKIK